MSEVFISKAPEDLEEHKKWVHQMVRIQVAMWIDGKSKCEYCGYIYTSVDDFLERNPRCANEDGDKGISKFVDDRCFEDYRKSVGK